MSVIITISKIRKFFLFVLMIIAISGCEEEKERIIPYSYVNFSIRLDDPQFITLSSIGNAVIITDSYDGSNSAGYDNNGIILYRASQDEFYAFDRTCTYDVKKSSAVEIDESGIMAVCPVCGSTYVLPNIGFPTKESPSKYALHQYQTHFDGLYVHVFN
jgi:nitrite reductase/ring-hydroxylating ferredoxin subunit